MRPEPKAAAGRRSSRSKRPANPSEGPPLATYKSIVAYDGTEFAGFQRLGQGQRTVQRVLEEALHSLGWGGERVLAAGRTDRGAHARGQVIAFRLAWRHSADALTGETESEAFDVDNTAPRIEVSPRGPATATATLAFVVRDDHSPIKRVEYSLDADRWRVIYPKDGIPDSRVEEFELTLEGDAAQKGVIIRATDAMNNVATAAATPRR